MATDLRCVCLSLVPVCQSCPFFFSCVRASPLKCVALSCACLSKLPVIFLVRVRSGARTLRRAFCACFYRSHLFYCSCACAIWFASPLNCAVRYFCRVRVRSGARRQYITLRFLVPVHLSCPFYSYLMSTSYLPHIYLISTSYLSHIYLTFICLISASYLRHRWSSWRTCMTSARRCSH